MKRKYMLVALAVIGILSWCSTVNADTIDLGTIQYSNINEKILIVEIESNISIDLIYVTSDIDNASLYIDSTWFSPLENTTTYVFATKQIEVEWWFKNDTKCFIYQDNTTKELYCVNIDYSVIEIPSNPVIEWMNKHNESVVLYNELNDLFEVTLNELNVTRKNLEIRWEIYNQSKEEFDNNSLLVIALQEDLEDLEIKYNTTKELWIDASANVSTLELHIGNLEGDYNFLQKEHNDLSGSYPVYIFFAILGTALILIFWFNRKKMFSHKEISDIEIERDTGYSPESSKIDRFTAGLVNKIKPNQKQVSPPNPLESKPKPDIDDIHKKIDEYKLNHDVFKESTVEDIQKIRSRVDIVETHLKIKA